MPAAVEAPVVADVLENGLFMEAALEDPEAAVDPGATDEESLLLPVLAFARFVGTTEEPCSSRGYGGEVEGNALAGRFRCMLVGKLGPDIARQSEIIYGDDSGGQ